MWKWMNCFFFKSMVPYIIVYRLKIQDDHSSRTKFDIGPFGENILNQSTIWNQIWLENFTTKCLLFVLNENPRRPPPQEFYSMHRAASSFIVLSTNLVLSVSFSVFCQLTWPPFYCPLVLNPKYSKFGNTLHTLVSLN